VSSDSRPSPASTSDPSRRGPATSSGRRTRANSVQRPRCGALDAVIRPVVLLPHALITRPASSARRIPLGCRTAGARCGPLTDDEAVAIRSDKARLAAHCAALSKPGPWPSTERCGTGPTSIAAPRCSADSLVSGFAAPPPPQLPREAGATLSSPGSPHDQPQACRRPGKRPDPLVLALMQTDGRVPPPHG
jgi:hypothetical protein